MKSLNEDIKNKQFRKVYLLYGEEAYLRSQYRNRLKTALSTPDDTMNVSVYTGKDISTSEIIDLAETLPFFADRRLIILEDTGFFKNGCDPLTEYIKDMPESTCIVFVEEMVDKRGRLYKSVKDSGRAVEFSRQEEAVLKKWILGQIKKENRQISGGALQLLLQRTGNDMENISKELEKLLCYTLHKDTITAVDVEAVCTVQTTSRIFDMINAVAAKQQKTALQLYYDLLTLKEPPMRIMFLLARQFNLLMQVKQLRRDGVSPPVIAEKTGLHSFIIQKYIAQAVKFSDETLRAAVEECVELETAVKTGRMNDVMSIELLLVKYSQAQN
ncbi:MAG: DNA polymerase III subunit delta [Lachnospiraceae bacterium]